jgi:hypothetical protein
MTGEMPDDESGAAERLFLAFAESEELPVAAIAEAVAGWPAYGDLFVETLRGYASGAFDPTADGNAPVILLHLMCQMRERRAFLPLLALLRQDPDMLEAALGDTLIDTLPRILVGVFDGDPTALEDLLVDRGADGSCRWSAIDAGLGLHLRDRIDAARVIRMLTRIADAGMDREDAAWVGWVKACGMIDDAALLARARAMIADGRIAPTGFGADELEAEIANGAGARQRTLDETAPIDDAAALMSTWYGFTEAGIAAGRKAATLGGSVGSDTYVNPYRDVGRNDPCPCGSGKKFKRCHGA